MEKQRPAWSAPIAVEDIPDTGLHIEIEAPVETRAELAVVAGLRSLPRLTAAFDLMKNGAQVDVKGTLSATIGQTCVVTLDPIENEIEEAIDVSFAPAGSRGTERRKAVVESPEPLVNGSIDLGALASEFLMLGIDPYPRKAGVQFAAPKTDDDSSHPFAALEALKKRSTSKQS